jgi:hypothetical protein
VPIREDNPTARHTVGDPAPHGTGRRRHVADAKTLAAIIEPTSPKGAPRVPSFVITIDTEEDAAWSRPRVTSTDNASFLERFQQLCEHYHQRPTWLTSHAMIASSTFRNFAADVIARGTGEIGMHLHAWNSPPFTPLTANDCDSQPYLIEYPAHVMREKIHRLTVTLEDVLGVKMISHRAGRWALDERYAEMLLEEGYGVDCSVTPLVSWASTLGNPAGDGGSDYRNFRHEPYWVDLADVSQVGASDLLEVPMTIISFRSRIVSRLLNFADTLPNALKPVRAVTRRVANRLFPEAVWLRPDARNGRQLIEVIDRVLAERRRHAEFMLHSSELMPGGSPTFQDSASIELLYANLEVLFAHVAASFDGATLSEFRDDFARSSKGHG